MGMTTYKSWQDFMNYKAKQNTPTITPAVQADLRKLVEANRTTAAPTDVVITMPKDAALYDSKLMSAIEKAFTEVPDWRIMVRSSFREAAEWKDTDPRFRECLRLFASAVLQALQGVALKGKKS